MRVYFFFFIAFLNLQASYASERVNCKPVQWYEGYVTLSSDTLPDEHFITVPGGWAKIVNETDVPLYYKEHTTGNAKGYHQQKLVDGQLYQKNGIWGWDERTFSQFDYETLKHVQVDITYIVFNNYIRDDEVRAQYYEVLGKAGPGRPENSDDINYLATAEDDVILGETPHKIILHYRIRKNPRYVEYLENPDFYAHCFEKQ